MIKGMTTLGMVVFVVITMIAIALLSNVAYAQEATFDTAPVETVEAAPVIEPPVVVETPHPPAVSYEAILLFIGTVIAGLIWFANQTNKRVQSSVPLELAITIAAALVKLTPTMTDDQLLERIKTLIDKPTPPGT